MNLTIRVGGKVILKRDMEKYNLKNIIHKHVLLHEIMATLEESQRKEEEEEVFGGSKTDR